MKGLYKMSGSKFWWFRWTAKGGKRCAISLKTDDESIAITRARGALAESLFSQRDGLEIQDALARYLDRAQKRAKKPMRSQTAHTSGNVIQRFIRDTGIEATKDIAHTKVESWLETIKSRCSADTVYTYTRAIKTFVGWLEKYKFLTPGLHAAIEMPERSPTGRKNWLKSEDCDRLIKESKDSSLTFILYCGFHAGLRRSEIAQAKVSWFDLEASLIHIQNDISGGFVLKDKENRTVPLTQEFRDFLKTFLANRDAQKFAVLPNKVKSRGKYGYRYDFRKIFQSHLARCGVQCCTIHDMRRSFASNLVSHGVSIYKVARWLGDGVQVVERSYGYLTPSDEEINKLSLERR